MQIYKTPLREFKFLIEDFLNLKESETLKKIRFRNKRSNAYY